MKVQFAWRYRSDVGAWNKGDQADLPDDLVAWLNRDSPGVCIALVDMLPEEPEPEEEESEEEESEEETEERQVEQPPADRMVKNARRRDRRGDPGDQGEITKDDFKAVKDKT